MAASYLEASLDRFGPEVLRDDTIEICINPDGQVWGEFQGDHFMRGLGSPLSPTEIKDLGNQIASAASTTLSTKKPANPTTRTVLLRTNTLTSTIKLLSARHQ